MSGAVRLDGTEMHHWDPDQLGRYMGYLPQDVKLFGGTVSENISRFEDKPSDADVIEAATLAGAHDMIQTLSNGYETEVGDGGMFVSGGQRQRVGLARAVYRHPSIVVLDEPNSNLDSVGEKALVSCIQELKKMGTTVVLVTHKANLLAMSDKTLMLVNGAVEKFGPTQEMFKKSPPATAVEKSPGTSPAVVQLPKADKSGG